MGLPMPTDSEPVVVWEGDCLGLLRRMPDGCVDAAITDPPYAEKTHAGARTRVVTGRKFDADYSGSVSLVGFDSLTPDAFLALCRELLRLTRRWVVLTCDWRHAALLEETVPDSFVRCGVWVKPDSAPQFSGDRPGTGWEAVAVLHRPGRKTWNGGGHAGVWTHPICRERQHPTQKPLGLVRQWVRLFTDPGETVLDPFGGSGTTAVAAMREGRRCVLIEKDPKYAALCRERIGKAMGKGSLLEGLA